MGPKHRKNFIIGTAALVIFCFILLSVPAPDPPVPPGIAGKPFTWRQDSTWDTLRTSLAEARSIGCERLKDRIDRGFLEARLCLAGIDAARLAPDASIFSSLEEKTFSLATMVAACPQKPYRLKDYIDLVTSSRSLLKKQSENWDMNDRAARDRLYRLLYGGRAALEEVMLQSPEGSYPALIPCEDVPSSTPSHKLRNLTVHSGDILVSRGGAPTSALIARGNDYPGNFSHVALLYIDANTGELFIIESHIERGVVISSPDEYIRDKKLRIMVLRLRPDLPQMKADPLLPHKAAKQAYENVKARHIPYDFEMDYKDPAKQFCSEVASSAYRPLGIDLWKAITHMSSPGVVKWLSYFGVTHFETQSPADLEYDPQLRVVAEWRDPDTLWQAHVDNAVIQAMLEGADRGDAIGYPWWELAAARLTKLYSVILNLFGKVGPVPEGMDATAALRNMELSAMHARIKKATLARADAFREKHGSRPPYWELVRMANEARAEVPG
jgi:hypothetical protein